MPLFPVVRRPSRATLIVLTVCAFAGIAGAQDRQDRRPALEGPVRSAPAREPSPDQRRPMPAEPDPVMLSENYLVNVAVAESGEDVAVLTLATVRSQFNAAALLGDTRHQMAVTGRLTELVEGKLFVELVLKVQLLGAGGDSPPAAPPGQEFFESAIVVSVDTPLVFLRSGERTYTLSISGIGPKTPEVDPPSPSSGAEAGGGEPRDRR